MEPGTEEANGVHPDPTWSFLQSFARPSKRPPRRMMQVVESVVRREHEIGGRTRTTTSLIHCSDPESTFTRLDMEKGAVSGTNEVCVDTVSRKYSPGAGAAEFPEIH